MIKDLAASIDDAVSLLREYGPISEDAKLPKQSALVGLVDQCKAMCAQADVADEPIRTIHHFACTGGTLISKCLAAMPNTQLLSEIDPLSNLDTNREHPVFAATNLIGQARQSTRGSDDATLSKIFLSGLAVLHDDAVKKGLRLILRDHAHSQFCTTQDAPSRPTMRQILQQRHEVFSIVTVRDPIESYIAMREHGWVHFRPATFDEYCARYMDFLGRYEHVPVFRYEDFVHDPPRIMQQICTTLDLPYQENFESLYDVFKLTGDSGRTGDHIAPRARKPVSDELQAEAAGSENYKRLRELMRYD